MERVNGMPLYWLGQAIGRLQVKLVPPIYVGQLVEHLIYVRSQLDFFFSSAQILPLSNASAKSMLVFIEQIIDSAKLQKLDEVYANKNLLNLLNTAIFSFQAVIAAELEKANVFYITPKRAYDTTILISNGEKVLSPELLILLDSSKDEIVNDIRESTKCLAFNIPTAVGFHTYRAVEAIIIKNYFPVLGITPGEWEKNKNLGHYIELLEGKSIDIKVTTMLRHLKDHYRNPISHPDEFWDLDKAESAFGLAVSVMTVMIQNIEQLKGAN